MSNRKRVGLVAMTALLAWGLVPETSWADLTFTQSENTFNGIFGASNRANINFNVAGTISGPAALVSGITQQSPAGLLLNFTGTNVNGSTAQSLVTRSGGTGAGLFNTAGTADVPFGSITETLGNPQSFSLLGEFVKLVGTGTATVTAVNNLGVNTLLTTNLILDPQGQTNLGVYAVPGSNQFLRSLTITPNAGSTLNSKNIIDVVGQATPTPVPEPSTVALVLSGLVPLGLMGLRRLRRRSTSQAG